MKSSPRKHEPAKGQTGSARFSSRFLPALYEVNGEAGCLLPSPVIGIQIERRDEGGIQLIAANTFFCVVIEDPDGCLHCDSPIRFELDQGFAEACKPPVPVELHMAGGGVAEVPLPPSMLPGDVMLVVDGLRPSSRHTVSPRPDGMSLLVLNAEQLPEGFDGEDGWSLRAIDGTLHGRAQVISPRPHPWRRVFVDDVFEPAESICISSDAMRLVGLFGKTAIFKKVKGGTALAVEYVDEPLVHVMLQQCAMRAEDDGGDDVSED